MAYLGQSLPRLMRNMVTTRGDIDRLNAGGLSDYADTGPERLVELMRRDAQPSGAGALYRGRVALIECLIHQQDIRRPLGRPRTIKPEALRISLDYARFNPVIGGARRTRGLRLVATDLDWSAGPASARAPEVRGTGEALLLAMTGRGAVVADELDGAGAARFA
ncbi:maleylpyruvate isomerase family mycothiol-dependent enzyme [Mycolicibacterium thermoresistibile]